MEARFHQKSIFGDHSIVSYDTATHPFRQYFETLYKTNDLEHLHQQSSADLSANLQDIETDLHKIFYKDIKTNPQFKTLYCQFIKAIFIYHMVYNHSYKLVYKFFKNFENFLF